MSARKREAEAPEIDVATLVEVATRAARQAVREEVLFAGPRLPPPPNDLEAEQLLTASALAGYVAETDVADWWGESLAAIFLAVAELRAEGLDPTDERIARVLRGCGDAGPLLAQELDTLRRATPVTVRLADMSMRIFRAARRRKALEHVTKVEALLRNGDCEDVDALIEELRVAAKELKRCRP